MPDYDFKCADCGHVFELHLSVAEHDKMQGVQCPKCNSKNVKPVMSVGGVITSKKS
ncbi:MAG: zinc ribbon domain-containing protein [Bacteroidota bacterium]